MMEGMVRWLRSEHGVNPVLEAGIAQFQLVHIHPFDDGNGRTSRLLSTLCLYRKGYDFKRLFTISEYYDRDRTAFYKAIQDVRERGMDLTGWLEYFTKGLATQMREVQERGEKVIRRDIVLAKARKEGLKNRPLTILALLMENRRTLQRDLKVLVERGLAREVGTGR